MSAVVQIDGEFHAPDAARISVFDHVVLYGDGVYDTLCVWNGRAFALDAHLDRLYRSAAALYIEMPVPRAQLVAWVLDTIARSALQQAYVKIIVSRGAGPQPLLATAGCQPSVIIFAAPYMSLNSADGARLVTVTQRRAVPPFPPAHVKSCNYLHHVLALEEARRCGADNALELDVHEHVLEAAGFNVFALIDGVLRTPAEHMLPGITRETVLALAAARQIPVHVGVLTYGELRRAEEVFLTSTAGGIVPVTGVDDRRYAPGVVTGELRADYWSLLAGC